MQIIAAVFFLILYMKNKQEIKSTYQYSKQLSLKKLMTALFLLLGWNCLLSSVDVCFEKITGLTLQAPMDSSAGNVNPFVLFLLIGIFPGVVEEILFRGILFRYLRKHGFTFAMVTSSLIFGLAHMNFLQFFFATGMGMICCYLFEKTGKMRYGMILHIINNSFAILYILLGWKQSTTSIVEGIGAVLFLVGALILKMKRITFNVGESMKKNEIANYRLFFLSIPMLLFVVAMLGLCVVCMVL